MANVHRLNPDDDRPNLNRPLLRPTTDEELNLFTNPIGFNRDPRDETFCDMLSFAFQIRLRKCSPVKLIIPLLTAFFVWQLCSDGIDPRNIENPMKSTFLQVNLLGSLSYSLAAVGHFVKQGQVYRILTCFLLHGDLPHLLANSFSLMILGSFVEVFYSGPLMVILLLFSGLVGNVYALCWAHPQTIAVGFSTSICGLSGALLGYLIFNWKNLASAVHVRMSLLLSVVWGFMMSVAMTSLSQISPQGNSVIGDAAHFGGFVAGTLLGMAIAPEFRNAQTTNRALVRYMVKAKLAGGVLFSLFALGCVVVFLM